MKNCEVLLLGKFNKKGDGIPSVNQDLLENLLQSDSVSVKALDFEPMYANSKFPRISKVAVNLAFPFLLNITYKNIHFLDPSHFQYQKDKNMITTIHDLYVFDKRLPHKLSNLPYNYVGRTRLENAIRYSDKLIAVSDITKQNLLNRYGAELNDKIQVIHPMISEKFFMEKPAYTPRTNEKDKVVFGYVNNFNWNKLRKLKLFIEQFKLSKNPNIEFRIYGKNFPFSDLIEGDKRIKAYGFLPEEKIIETMKGFDYFVVSSELEGVGLGVVQAKALHIPVLLYNGDIDDTVKNNTLLWREPSSYVKGQRIDALEEVFDGGQHLYYQENRSQALDAMLRRGREDAESFRPKTILPQILDLYKNVFE
ncbi:MAG: glycosyltransferase family 4 protein [Candidatus Parvarchaeota archaeon]|nr:glycosyltransferase family 4 protein [Candidatus Parvarchaeota archaeon]